MIADNENQLNDLEKIIVIETLYYLENIHRLIFRKISPLLKQYIIQSNMKTYKIQYLDLKTLQEQFVYLDNQVAERIFIQCYLIISKMDKLSSNYHNELNEIFPTLNEYRIEQLISLILKFNNGEIPKEELYSNCNSTILKTSVKLQAMRLFEKFKSSTKRINEEKLNKFNRGGLKRVWEKVIDNLEIINNPNTPSHLKVIAIAALIYVVTPMDAIPDIVPIGGLVDDAAIVLLALEQIKKLTKKV